MKKIIVLFVLVALTLTAGTAAAQQAPFNEVGVTMGHWHIASKDAEANKKLFLAMGGKLMSGPNPQIMFPGVLIPAGASQRLALGTVTVRTRVEPDALLAAPITHFDVTTESGGAARFNGGHDAALCRR